MGGGREQCTMKCASYRPESRGMPFQGNFRPPEITSGIFSSKLTHCVAFAFTIHSVNHA